MKKILVGILCVGLCISGMTACGTQSAKTKEEVSDVAAQEAEPAEKEHVHEWIDATCTEPKTCATCGATEGDPLGHSVDEWTVTEEATCSEEGEREGECTVCGETIIEPIEKTDHEWKWKVIKKATYKKDGKKQQVCKVCGAKGKTKSYSMSKKKAKKAYKEDCKSYSYKEIARDPDDYEGKMAYFKGEVIQVMEDGNTVALRVDVTPTSWGYTDTIMVAYERSDGESRILEDDIIKMWGQLGGNYTYETVMGAEMTIPLLVAKYIEIAD